MDFSILLVMGWGTWPSPRPRSKSRLGRKERKGRVGRESKVLSSIHHVPGPEGSDHIVLLPLVITADIIVTLPQSWGRGLREEWSLLSLGGRHAVSPLEFYQPLKA